MWAVSLQQFSLKPTTEEIKNDLNVQITIFKNKINAVSILTLYCCHLLYGEPTS
jgi:hypothetical protein